MEETDNWILPRGGIVARAYASAHALWWQFRGSPYAHETPSRTDLCTLMQTIIVRAPLALALNLAAIGGALFVAGYFLGFVWIWRENVWAILMFVGGTTLLVVASSGAVIAVNVLSKKAVRSEPARVAVAYYKAKKQSICPLVEIRGVHQ